MQQHHSIHRPCMYCHCLLHHLDPLDSHLPLQYHEILLFEQNLLLFHVETYPRKIVESNVSCPQPD
eukprot:Gb_07507 [translate_table: standard]